MLKGRKKKIRMLMTVLNDLDLNGTQGSLMKSSLYNWNPFSWDS